ncbi:MAG: hypothetical protein COT45_01810 [bacterium (Candidatus Stahlbacteria) CG08_land_8_20_14_0_20_40_26]|nr:MAG: hypothetical protein COX49_09785 [bacterium (Candidatus Stahlbacteria) CG23_combo_of_CG06-09_8_20_14_all_40_9]PIS25823.1 MAG: hypothetical protein COT45_01810 [bacterium (Candidatus Stahlbacteria) CG08_land_8_20_14_0_20_40_26]
MQKNYGCLHKKNAHFDYYGFADSLFFKYVANPRILWEEFGVDYPVLEETFAEFIGKPPKEVANGVMRFIQRKGSFFLLLAKQRYYCGIF